MPSPINPFLLQFINPSPLACPFLQVSMPGDLAAAYPSLSAVLADAGYPSGGMACTAFAKGNSGPSSESQMFEGLVVPGLQASMGWQTWRTLFGAFGRQTCRYDSKQSMNASCGIQPGSWASINIQNLSVPAGLLRGRLMTAAELPDSPRDELQLSAAAWSSCDDHSKWGAALPLEPGRGRSGSMAEPPQAPWVCFCDNSR